MFVFRPDASSVWSDPEVKRRLSRYWGIMQGERRARYLVAKKLSVNPALNIVHDSEEELWKHHDAAGSEFPQFLAEIDEGSRKFSRLKTPEVSFLDLKSTLARKMLTRCTFCERKCRKDRTAGELGVCRVSDEAVVSSAFLHMGEESVLVPSGTIFFSGCTFKCVFCQNHSISQEWRNDDDGQIVDGVIRNPEQIARIARDLAQQGARNINWVGGDPTSNIHSILASLQFLEQNITQLWNSNMFLSEQSMEILLHLVDFWLPDFKYWDSDFAQRMSGIRNYREVITRNIKMAHDHGSGEMVIRHLVMPNRVEEDTLPILDWCAHEVPNALVNIMGQYRPEFRVLREPDEFSDINRRPTANELRLAKETAESLGIMWKPVS
jgi:putative pyruvate formate lyase activating enzyme